MKKKLDENTTVALMGKDIGYIQKDIGEIKDAIKGLSGVFASKED